MNATPLIWGLILGPQVGQCEMRFELPSVCAALLRSGEIDIGLVPVIELERQNLEALPGLGIASRGPVRSILLISKVPAAEISTLSVDASSRTSVVLASLILQERFGVAPSLTEQAPDVAKMLAGADACLVIGDPALRFTWSGADRYVYDLGEEWTLWTGLPMVFAVWAARNGFDWKAAGRSLRESWEFGRDRIDEIARAESVGRGVPVETARGYLTHNIHFELGTEHVAGWEHFRRLARAARLV